MRKRQLCLAIFMSLVASAGAQSLSSWVNYEPNNTFYSFSLPDSALFIFDTLQIKVFSYKSAEGVELISAYQKHDSSFLSILNKDAEEDSLFFLESDTLSNPLVALTEFYKSYYPNTEVIVIQNLLTLNPEIEGREIGITYTDEKTLVDVVFYIRAYCKGTAIVGFIAQAPLNKLTEYNLVKNSFFSSILTY